MEFRIIANNEAETRWIAEELAALLNPSDVILLEGNLGAGKTTFTKGIAEGLGIPTVIKSPTYTIIREYSKGRIPLYHMDVYRLEEAGGDELGLDEYFYGEGVSVVEWSSFIPDDLPKEHLKITLLPAEDDFKRELVFESAGPRYHILLGDLKEKLIAPHSEGIK